MIDFLVSINKISLIIFVITFAILIYEYRLLKKEGKKRKTPKIPQFSDTYAASFQKDAKVVIFEEKEEKFTRHSPRLFVFLVIITLFFALLTLIGFFSKSEEVSFSSKLTPTSIVEERVFASEGIEIFDENFNLLKEEKLVAFQPGQKIIVGIKTIPQADIDKARIRVNKDFWEIGDETNKFNQKNQVFYIEYQLATGESKLKIEAQLHSLKEGWLGE